MADNEHMPKFNLDKDKATVNKSTIDFMKIIEKENLERVNKLKKVKRANLITAIALGAGVFSIYAYSMLAVKQETFLDDFDEPEIEPAKDLNL